MTAAPLAAIVSKESVGDCSFASYIIRIYEGWQKAEEADREMAIATYDANTINLRAATEFLGMATRKHHVDAEDVHFDESATDLEPMWRSYAELR